MSDSTVRKLQQDPPVQAEQPIDQLLVEEIRGMRSEINKLSTHVALLDEQLRAERLRTNGISSTGLPLPKKSILRAYMRKNNDGRKPYLLRLDGPISFSAQLTEVRAAILLVLLLDLEDRTQGGRGIIDRIDWINKAITRLSRTEVNPNQLPNNSRVALHRFELFFNEEADLTNEDLSLRFDTKNLQLELQSNSDTEVANATTVELSCEDAALSTIMDEALDTSPLSTVRKRGSLYVPEGAWAYERLVLEMFDHPNPFAITTVYFRVATINYPDSILEAMRSTENLRKRRALALDGYASGRFRFQEILSRETLWDIIRYCPKKGFKLYPEHITAEHVEEQLDTLIDQLQRYENYHMVITDAPIPFYLGTTRIQKTDETEHYTYFPRLEASNDSRQTSCFVMSNPAVYHDVHSNIVSWLLAHPLSINNREEVIATIAEIRDHFLTEGPLPIAAS